MFIRLYDVKVPCEFLLPVTEIVAVKEYVTRMDSKNKVLGAKTVVMTRPLNSTNTHSHDYFVSQNISEVEQLINIALSE